jgi:hypothetical protein
MCRGLASLIGLLTFTLTAQADFYFLIPHSDANGTLQLVFNDSPKVNTNTQVAEDLKLKTSQGVIPTKVGGAGWLAVPSSESGTTYGVIEHGVQLRGQRDLAFVLFYVKHQSELLNTPSSVPNSALELEAVRRGRGVSFIAKHQNQPLANADVIVYVPGEKRWRAVRTDSLGSTTSFEPEGLYAARIYHKEQKAGEFQGRNFQEVRHYATLTVNVKNGK